MFAEVIVDLKSNKIEPYYDYIVPTKYKDIIDVGMRVEVPFLNMHKMGVVYQLKDKSELATKEIIDLIDPYPVIDEEIFYLFNEIKQKTYKSDPRIFYEVVPKEFIYKNKKIVEALDFDKIPADLKEKFNKQNKWILKKQDQVYYQRIRRLEKNNIIKINNSLVTTYSKKEKEYFVYNKNHNYKRTFLEDIIYQIEDYEFFQKKDLKDLGLSNSKINTWIKHEVIINTNIKEELKTLKIELTNKEEELFKTIIESSNIKYLIKEAKTNDALNLIKKLAENYIEQNKKLLILTPNIKTANDIYKIFTNYFTNTVLYHSKMTLIDKNKTFRNVINNKANIIIGTRSTSFLPIKALGAIIMLDAQDDSYIKTDGVYYDTKDVLYKKALYNNVPVIYISKTPPIGLMYEGEKKKLKYYDFYNGENKYNIELVDMKQALLEGNTTILSKELKENIDKTLKANKKVALFYNKKGYASYLLCRSCGFIPKCPFCDVSLRYYKNKLSCPYCNYTEEYSNLCPNCKQKTIKEVGIGLDYIYDFLKNKYKVLVIDKSTAKNEQEIIKKLEDNNYDIVLGTQYLKSFSFNNIGLLGFVLVDSLLNYPIFNIKEKSYYEIMELITNFNAKTLMQTYNKDHEVLNFVKSNYNDFYTKIIKDKKLLKQPPFYEVSYILFQGKSMLKTYQEAFLAKKLLNNEGYLVLGPTEDTIKKIKEEYRFNLVIKKPFIDTKVVFPILDRIKNIATITYSEVSL